MTFQAPRGEEYSGWVGGKVGQMVRATAQFYVVTDPGILSGEPIVRGTRTPVRAIVELWRLGIPAEELPQHLPHLTLARVFGALSYCSDHQDEINAHIERNRIPADWLGSQPNQR